MTIMRCKWWHHNVPYCHLRCLVSGSNFKSMVISFLASWEMCLQYLGSNWYMPWHPQNQHLQLQVDDTKTENPKEPEKGWRQKGRISGHHLKNITMIQDTMTMVNQLNELTNIIKINTCQHHHHAARPPPSPCWQRHPYGLCWEPLDRSFHKREGIHLGRASSCRDKTGHSSQGSRRTLQISHPTNFQVPSDWQRGLQSQYQIIKSISTCTVCLHVVLIFNSWPLCTALWTSEFKATRHIASCTWSPRSSKCRRYNRICLSTLDRCQAAFPHNQKDQPCSLQ